MTNPFLWYRDKCGYSVIPISDDKKPVMKWKKYQSEHATEADCEKWFEKGYRVGIVTGMISNLAVVDCDKRCDAMWFYQNRAKSPVIAKTRRGFHFYFKHPGVHVPNSTSHEMYDIRGDGGFVVAPPSQFGEVKYEFINDHKLKARMELPLFDMNWCPRPASEDCGKKIKDGMKYILNIEAVMGAGGDRQTYRAACCLKDAGMSEAEALAAMCEWNQIKADPPWGVDDLLRKVQEAYK